MKTCVRCEEDVLEDASDQPMCHPCRKGSIPAPRAVWNASFQLCRCGHQWLDHFKQGCLVDSGCECKEFAK